MNIYLWLASRMIPFDFGRNLLHQFGTLILLLILAFACREATLSLPLGDAVSLARFLVSGVLYSLLTAGLALFFPALLGLSRQELRELFRRTGHALRILR